jgi:hypothetical protein
VICDEYDDSADDCDEHAVQVEPGYSGCTEKSEQPAADNPSDDPEHDVEEEALALLFTILLPIKPAISPRTIQPMIDISVPPSRLAAVEEAAA